SADGSAPARGEETRCVSVTPGDHPSKGTRSAQLGEVGKADRVLQFLFLRETPSVTQWRQNFLPAGVGQVLALTPAQSACSPKTSTIGSAGFRPCGHLFTGPIAVRPRRRTRPCNACSPATPPRSTP